MQGNTWIWDVTTGNWMPGPASSTENFIRIGHSLLALLLAFVGGLWSRYLYGQGRRRERGAPQGVTRSELIRPYPCSGATAEPGPLVHGNLQRYPSAETSTVPARTASVSPPSARPVTAATNRTRTGRSRTSVK